MTGGFLIVPQTTFGRNTYFSKRNDASMRKWTAMILALICLMTGCAGALGEETGGTDYAAKDAAPEWADVTLNARGYIDEGEYVLEDAENGRWMYVSPTLRIQIVRTYETFEKVKKKDPDQAFYCFTAEIWCDIGAGERPHTVFTNPEKPKSAHDFIANIAADNQVVFATSTDYYTYRIKQKYPTGIEVRNGEIIFDEPRSKPEKLPNYDTLALYADGHVESLQSKDRSAQEYIDGGATEVYTFGPCIVRDGELTEYIATANRSNNPRHAFGMVEPGHYVDVLCEGRVGKSKTMMRSTGVMMENLAQIMLDRGCQIAVNLDGGQTAVMAFMGKQLNRVVKSDPKGRKETEVLAFGHTEKNLDRE